MASLINLNSYLTPGTYVSEQTAGAIPSSLASHTAAYMLGFSTKGPKNTPTFVVNGTDFANVFGNSLDTASYPAVMLFFAQRPGVGLWFVNVKTNPSKSLTIATVTVGNTYSITVSGRTFEYVAVTGDTSATVLAALAAQVNKTLDGSVAYMTPTAITYDPAVVISVSTGITLGTEVIPATYPVALDVQRSLAESFNTEYDQGYLMMPEFYSKAGTTSNQVATLQSVAEAHCSDPRYLWVSLVDSSPAVGNAANPGSLVLAALAERQLFASPRGHSAYFVPYLKLNDAQATVVAPSAAIAGVAIRRSRAEGFRQPPAGTQFPVYGITDTVCNITDEHQGSLNPKGINCVRRLPNKGVVVWGSRSLNTDGFFRFIATRVIMNVLGGTLRRSFDSLIFSSVDGLGVLYAQIKGTAVGHCETLRLGGALYGSTPEAAYLVVCDDSNNPPTSLESGIVNLDVYVKPSPVMEVLAIRMTRTSLGENLVEYVNANLTNPLKEGETQGTPTGA